MSTKTLVKPKNKKSTTFSPVFGKKLSGRTFTPQPAHEVRDVSNPEFGHNFGDVQVESQSFKQSCPLALSGPAHCPFGGACHTCPPRIQAKLKIGQSGDKYEQEADRVADQVMSMPEPQVQRKACLSCNDIDEEEQIQTKPITEQVTPLVQRQEAVLEEEEEEEVVQAKQAFGQSPNVTPELANNIHPLRGCGQPLPESTRAFFEPRFRRDFSDVRVHADARAAEAAQVVNAKAFTLGNDVVFGQGQYGPRTKQGKHLLAHELMHVVQRNNGDSNRIFRQTPAPKENKPTPRRSEGAACTPIQSTVLSSAWAIATAWNRIASRTLPREGDDQLAEYEPVLRRAMFLPPQTPPGVKTLPSAKVKIDWNLIREYQEAYAKAKTAFDQEPTFKCVEETHNLCKGALLAVEKNIIHVCPKWLKPGQELALANTLLKKIYADYLDFPKWVFAARMAYELNVATIVGRVRAATELDIVDSLVLDQLKEAFCRTLNENVEFCGGVFNTPDGGFDVTEPVTIGELTDCTVSYEGDPPVATYHSHPRIVDLSSPMYRPVDRNLKFSDKDKYTADYNGIIMYLVNQNGEVLKYFPKESEAVVRDPDVPLGTLRDLTCNL